MPRRLRRVLLRTGLVVLVLALVGLVVFSWIAYWPLESRVDRVAALVPGGVDFVMRASWRGLEDTGWIQTNVLDHPLVSELREGVVELKRQLKQLPEMEAQINAQIPLGITHFSFEQDVVPDEIVAAGRWCSDVRPPQPPTWYEILVLTRVSWKTRTAVAALRHGFVRNMMSRDVTIDDLGDGVLRVTVHTLRVSPPAMRRCGAGQERGPENVWYLTRVRDVLAVSNAESLIRGVVDLAEFPGSGRAYVDRPNIDLDLRPGAISASSDLKPLQAYFSDLLGGAGPHGGGIDPHGRSGPAAPTGSPLAILSRYVAPASLDRMNGVLSLPSTDQVRGHAEIRYVEDRLAHGMEEVYRLQPAPTRSGISKLVPAADTFGALLLRTPPLHLLRGISQDVLSPSERQLWADNARRLGYPDLDVVLSEFAAKLDDTAGIAMARISDVYDHMDYDKFFPSPGEGFHDPNLPAIAMMVRLRQDTSPEEFDAYLSKRVPLFGLKPEVEKVEYKGLTYSRGHLEVEAADFADISPAWILAQNHFIFSNNESYFRKILDTLVDPKAAPPLADDPTFRAAMDQLPDEVHVALYLNLARLFQVPPSSAPGGEPRGFLWDRRNLWVNANRNEYEPVKQFGIQLGKELQERSGRPLTDQQLDEIDRQKEAFAKQYEGRYPEFIEERRQELLGYGRLRALGVSFVARQETLYADLGLLLSPPLGGLR